MGGMYGGMPYGPGMYGGLPPYAGQLNYPIYYNGGQGMMPGYDPRAHNGMSALAGAGLSALNMTPSNYYSGGADYNQYLNDQYNSQPARNPAEFEDKSRIIDGRDINNNNKDQLKLLLAQQLGQMNRSSHRDRPPSNS